MEEVQNYLLAMSSILIAGIAVYSVFLLLGIPSLTQRTKALRTGVAVIIIGVGLWAMHALGSLSLQGKPDFQEGVLFPYAVYGITIAVLLFLFSRLRLLLGERDQLKELAYKDALTGLLNKNGMDHFWDHCKENEQLAVLFLDLNRFKSINDTLGHHVGDLLLEAVGGKLSQFSSKGKRHIFRIGGDEFVIVAKRCSQKEAEQLAVKILETTTCKYKLEQHHLFVSASIGITLSYGKTERGRLLKEADTAMYNAKQLGTGRYSVYKPDTANADYAKWYGNFKAK
ncbi:GGDEF domain-containing protein [Paenibacillus albidus]|uniref:GGDEF domain-containing protein n=1 Tax=Paenibacillus albidus TaxID=2041023 RepID=UPI001BEAEFD3|nr:GGDEF domain-containing protein [Paenibacillus albidus]MBT2291003.1 GGDEF domain-containing protein [Paenibacillus albidus]